MSATPGEAAPPPDVLRAFGAAGTPERLPGGRGLTWRVGHVVLRPVAGVEEAMWKSQVLSELRPSREFTFPMPIADDRGMWVRDGWQAMAWIAGAADATRVADVIRTGSAFHRAIAELSRPSFIATSDDAWARADRSAWGETDLPADPLLERLAAEFRPSRAAQQVIHGDLLGNVMFATGRPPAVIDWAPYWRPAGTGAAIAVVDAVCWHHHPVARLAHSYGHENWRQLLLRSLAFRMTTLHLLSLWNEGLARRHVPVAEAIIALHD